MSFSILSFPIFFFSLVRRAQHKSYTSKKKKIEGAEKLDKMIKSGGRDFREWKEMKISIHAKI